MWSFKNFSDTKKMEGISRIFVRSLCGKSISCTFYEFQPRGIQKPGEIRYNFSKKFPEVTLGDLVMACYEMEKQGNEVVMSLSQWKRTCYLLFKGKLIVSTILEKIDENKTLLSCGIGSHDTIQVCLRLLSCDGPCANSSSSSEAKMT